MSKVSKYALAAIAFAIGYAVTLIGFKNATAVEGQSEAMVELFFTFCSPNVALMTFAIFLIAKDLRFENKRVNRFISQFSIYTFGIWMCHYLFVGPVFLLFKSCEMPVLLKVFLENILVLLASFALVYLVRSTGTFGKKIMG